MAGRRRSGRALRSKLRSPGRPPVARQEHRRRFWALIAGGLSSEDAAIGAGVSAPVTAGWPVLSPQPLLAITLLRPILTISRALLLRSRRPIIRPRLRPRSTRRPRLYRRLQTWSGAADLRPVSKNSVVSRSRPAVTASAADCSMLGAMTAKSMRGASGREGASGKDCSSTDTKSGVDPESPATNLIFPARWVLPRVIRDSTTFSHVQGPLCSRATCRPRPPRLKPAIRRGLGPKESKCEQHPPAIHSVLLPDPVKPLSPWA